MNQQNKKLLANILLNDIELSMEDWIKLAKDEIKFKDDILEWCNEFYPEFQSKKEIAFDEYNSAVEDTEQYQIDNEDLQGEINRLKTEIFDEDDSQEDTKCEIEDILFEISQNDDLIKELNKIIQYDTEEDYFINTFKL